MKAIIATENEGKIESARQALEKFYDNVEVIGIKTPSEVSEQPINEEIYQGVTNRVTNLIKYCHDNKIDTDLYVAIESGLTNQLGPWFILNIAEITDGSLNSYGVAPSFPVPDKYVETIKQKGLNE